MCVGRVFGYWPECHGGGEGTRECRRRFRYELITRGSYSPDGAGGGEAPADFGVLR